MSISRWAHKENVVYIATEYYSAIKKNEASPFATTWMELKSIQFSSVAQSCPTLCDPMNCSTRDLPVHHQLQGLAQTPRDSKGQKSLACFCEWGHRVRHDLATKQQQIYPHLVAPSCLKVKMKVAQSCPTIFDPMDYTVHGIFQARILEWVAFPFSRGSFWSLI